MVSCKFSLKPIQWYCNDPGLWRRTVKACDKGTAEIFSAPLHVVKVRDTFCQSAHGIMVKLHGDLPNNHGDLYNGFYIYSITIGV